MHTEQPDLITVHQHLQVQPSLIGCDIHKALLDLLVLDDGHLKFALGLLFQENDHHQSKDGDLGEEMIVLFLPEVVHPSFNCVSVEISHYVGEVFSLHFNYFLESNYDQITGSYFGSLQVVDLDQLAGVLLLAQRMFSSTVVHDNRHFQSFVLEELEVELGVHLVQTGSETLSRSVDALNQFTERQARHLLITRKGQKSLIWESVSEVDLILQVVLEKGCDRAIYLIRLFLTQLQLLADHKPCYPLHGFKQRFFLNRKTTRIHLSVGWTRELRRHGLEEVLDYNRIALFGRLKQFEERSRLLFGFETAQKGVVVYHQVRHPKQALQNLQIGKHVFEDIVVLEEVGLQLILIIHLDFLQIRKITSFLPKSLLIIEDNVKGLEAHWVPNQVFDGDVMAH